MKKLFLLLIVCSFSFLSIAKDWDKIRIGTEGAFPPFNAVDKNGNLIGLDIDFVKELCAELKVQCTLQTQDWDGIIPALLAKKYDAIVASMSITEDRKKTIDFTIPYYTTPNKFVAKKGRFSDTSPKALAKKRIGVQKATISENFITDNYPKSTIKSYVTVEEAFLDLTAGRVDLVFNDALSSDEGFVKKPAGKGFEFVGPAYSGGKYFGEGIGIGVRKSDKDLTKLLNKGIKALYDNGKFKKIADEYFPETNILVQH